MLYNGRLGRFVSCIDVELLSFVLCFLSVFFEYFAFFMYIFIFANVYLELLSFLFIYLIENDMKLYNVLWDALKVYKEIKITKVGFTIIKMCSGVSV